PPVAYAAVYHGSPAAIGPTTFVDDTFQGNSDTSSIISGVIVQFGDSVTVQFSNGKVGDTALATLYGQVSNRPDEFTFLSPGTHFGGHAATGVTSLVLVNEPITVNTTTVDRALGFVGNNAYVGLRISTPTDKTCRATLNFYAEAAFTTLLGTFEAHIGKVASGVGGKYVDSIPVSGPYARLS